jgi:hypothetical protein
MEAKMRKDEINFLKHCLTDYDFYFEKIRELRNRQDRIQEERAALAINTSSVLKLPEKGKEPINLYSTARWHELILELEEIDKQIDLFFALINYTEETLFALDEPLQDMLRDLYLWHKPRSEVAKIYYYSDDKSMYRAIRTMLKQK